jgi:hypothetical protein
MFEEVSFQDLVVGKKYQIKSLPESGCYHTGIFKEDNGFQAFERVMYHGYGSREVFNCEFKYKFYYAFVSQKERIQQAMEQRALDIVLKRIVNEEFIW